MQALTPRPGIPRCSTLSWAPLTVRPAAQTTRTWCPSWWHRRAPRPCISVLGQQGMPAPAQGPGTGSAPPASASGGCRVHARAEPSSEATQRRACPQDARPGASAGQNECVRTCRCCCGGPSTCCARSGTRSPHASPGRLLPCWATCWRTCRQTAPRCRCGRAASQRLGWPVCLPGALRSSHRWLCHGAVGAAGAAHLPCGLRNVMREHASVTADRYMGPCRQWAGRWRQPCSQQRPP